MLIEKLLLINRPTCDYLVRELVLVLLVAFLNSQSVDPATPAKIELFRGP